VFKATVDFQLFSSNVMNFMELTIYTYFSFSDSALHWIPETAHLLCVVLKN